MTVIQYLEGLESRLRADLARRKEGGDVSWLMVILQFVIEWLKKLIKMERDSAAAGYDGPFTAACKSWDRCCEDAAKKAGGVLLVLALFTGSAWGADTADLAREANDRIAAAEARNHATLALTLTTAAPVPRLVSPEEYRQKRGCDCGAGCACHDVPCRCSVAQKPAAKPARPAVRESPCSPQCTCGCNVGGSCGCKTLPAKISSLPSWNAAADSRHWRPEPELYPWTYQAIRTMRAATQAGRYAAPANCST